MFSFPNDYQLLARSPSTGEPQIDLIVRLLAMLQEAFSLERWTPATPTPVTHDYLAEHFNKKKRQLRPDLNVPMGLTIASPAAEIRILIDTGSQPLEPSDADSFNILFNGDFKKPNSSYWLRALELISPVKARLCHCNNGFAVESQERIHKHGPLKPAACFGLDYYSGSVLENLGGKAYVLKTPAHRTSEFLDGVLIELVPGFYFDPNNAEHLKIQILAMRHLGIDD